MYHAASGTFERLPLDEKVDHLFDLAYTISGRTNADDYPEAEFEAFMSMAEESLPEFTARALAIREQQYMEDTPKAVPGPHSISSMCRLQATFSHFRDPKLKFAITSVTGIDTRGYNLFADRLSILDSSVVPPEAGIIEYGRINFGPQRPVALRHGPSASKAMSALCVQLELIEITQ